MTTIPHGACLYVLNINMAQACYYITSVQLYTKKQVLLKYNAEINTKEKTPTFNLRKKKSGHPLTPPKKNPATFTPTEEKKILTHLHLRKKKSIPVPWTKKKICPTKFLPAPPPPPPIIKWSAPNIAEHFVYLTACFMTLHTHPGHTHMHTVTHTHTHTYTHTQHRRLIH